MSDIFKNFTVQEVLLLGIIIYVCVIILRKYNQVRRIVCTLMFYSFVGPLLCNNENAVSVFGNWIALHISQ